MLRSAGALVSIVLQLASGTCCRLPLIVASTAVRRPVRTTVRAVLPLLLLLIVPLVCGRAPSRRVSTCRRVAAIIMVVRVLAFAALAQVVVCMMECDGVVTAASRSSCICNIAVIVASGVLLVIVSIAAAMRGVTDCEEAR